MINIPGVGKKTAKKMNTMSITIIGDLARYDIQRLVESFGRNMGVYFHNAITGKDADPVHEVVKSESISRMSTLHENTRDLNVLLAGTDQLILSIHKDLLNSHFNFKRVGIIIILDDLSTRSKSKILSISSDKLFLIKKTIQSLFDSFLSESKMEIRRIGVKISQLSVNEEKQKKLSTFL